MGRDTHHSGLNRSCREWLLHQQHSTRRDSKAPKRRLSSVANSVSLWSVAVTVAGLLPAAAAGQLSPLKLVDLHLVQPYLVQAEAAIKEPDYHKAREAMAMVSVWQRKFGRCVGLETPTEFYYFYADVLSRTGSTEFAFEQVVRYLELAGREAPNYMAALKLRDRLERKIAELEQAERERAAKVAAIRQRAARELPAEIRAMEFVRIPAGRFRMGSEGGEADDDEGPVRRVRIRRAFEIGKYEVTQSEWSAVMGQNPSSRACGRCPVTDVSWNDVQEFIEILNQAVGQDDPYRLPTEAEWECAARAGTKGERYASDVDVIAWHGGNSGGRPRQVGGKQANPFGVHDMLGNVSEWVQDRYGPYSGGGVTDPAGPSTGSYRVARGGSWYHHASWCRAAVRAPGRSNLGFRLPRTVQ